jgi:hypothetical protein
MLSKLEAVLVDCKWGALCPSDIPIQLYKAGNKSHDMHALCINIVKHVYVLCNKYMYYVYV